MTNHEKTNHEKLSNIFQILLYGFSQNKLPKFILKTLLRLNWLLRHFGLVYYHWQEHTNLG